MFCHAVIQEMPSSEVQKFMFWLFNSVKETARVDRSRENGAMALLEIQIKRTGGKDKPPSSNDVVK